MTDPFAERGQAEGHVLDNPVYVSLRSPQHAALVRGRGRVLRYLDDVSPFMGLPRDASGEDWDDAARLLGTGTAFVHHPGPVPQDWTVLDRFEVLQMTAPRALAAGGRDPRIVRLGTPDVPEMLDLARRTRPGPFLTRTVETGTYLGVRHDGALVAMAGERMRAPGWVEISAVCTEPGHRGKGLGTALIRALAAGIAAGGSRAFLHVTVGNTGAVALYRALGFTVRRQLGLTVLRRPERAAVGSS